MAASEHPPIATIGHAGTSAESFFTRLRDARVERLLDIRLRPVSQFATFAHQRDLPYFLRELCGIDYEHDVRLAPDDDLLDAYRGKKIGPDDFHERFRQLMDERGIPGELDPAAFDRKTALLCSEASPDHCHRRIVAELLASTWSRDIEHL